MKGISLFESFFLRVISFLIVETVLLVFLFSFQNICSCVSKIFEFFVCTLSNKATNIVKIFALFIVLLAFIGFNFFVCFYIAKDDSSIRLKKLEELKNFESEISSFINLNPCEKEVVENKSGYYDKKEIYYKNYKFDLYKKYLDILAEI